MAKKIQRPKGRVRGTHGYCLNKVHTWYMKHSKKIPSCLSFQSGTLPSVRFKDFLHSYVYLPSTRPNVTKQYLENIVTNLGQYLWDPNSWLEARNTWTAQKPQRLPIWILLMKAGSLSTNSCSDCIWVAFMEGGKFVRLAIVGPPTLL